MTLLPDLGHVIDAGSGALLIVLGAWVFRVARGQPVRTPFALFSVAFGLMLVCGNAVSNDDPLAPALQALAAALALPALVGVVGLALRFPRPLAAWERRLAWLVGVPVLAAGAMFFGSGLDEPFTPQLAVGLFALQYGLLFATLLFAFRFARASGPGAARERQLCALMAVALLPWPALFGMTRFNPVTHVTLLADRGVVGWLAESLRESQLLFGLTTAAVFVVAYLVWLRNTARPDPASARLARHAALLTLAAPVVAEGLLQTPLAEGGGGSGLYGASRILTVAILAYAILRYRLFDIDLRIKGTLRQSTVVALFLGAYLLASQAAQVLVGGTAGAVVGLVAIAALVVFIAPLQRAASGLVDAAMPGVSASPEYLNLRKVEVYRAAIEQAAAAGHAFQDDEGLARLRAELGLTDRDHALLAYAARTGTQPAMLDLEAGALLLDRYRVQRFLGEGAHGRTYLARDEAAGRDVVLKAIRPDKAGDPALLREARAIAAIAHPNVVRLHEVQQVRDAVFIVMEYLEGGSLRARLDRGPLTPAEFRRVALGLLDALGAVHAAGIVHRDVKPSNVLLAAGGEAKLADFGIAHLPGLETTVGGASGGTAVGTIRYMSPEQAKGRKVTPRSDLFSAAATLCEAWTGKPYLEPGPRESPIELQMRAAAGQPFKAKVQPPAMRAWFAKALDPDPARRFPSAAAMRAALERALPGIEVTGG